MKLTMVLGGSTNAVLHSIAMARAFGIDLTIDDWQRVSDETPMLADFRPSGKYVMEDLHKVGGMPGVIRMLVEAGVLDGSQMTCTGKTLAENVSALPALLPYGHGPGKQDIVHPLNEPIKRVGHIRILRGSLAPGGSVAKITGKEGTQFTGPARVFDSEEAMIQGLEQGRIQKGDVIVIRYEGPKGGPGMPEMLTPTAPWPAPACSTTSPSSPTAVSPAAPTASSSATSPPRPSTAAPSPWPATATASPSTARPARSTSRCRRRSWQSAEAPGPVRRSRRSAGRCTSTSKM